MARHHDYIPAKDADFDHWAKNFADYAVQMTTGSPPEWTHIPAARVTGIVSSFRTWHAAYEATLVPHIPAATILKNEERKKTEHLFRNFKEQYLDFEEVTDAQRVNAGVPPKDTIPTPYEKPETVPLITKMEAIGGCQIRLHFKDEKAEKSRAVLPGCNGCLLTYTLADDPVEDKSLLNETRLLTASPSVVAFPLFAQRKWLSVAGRWQLRKEGILGPQGPVEHVIIT